MYGIEFIASELHTISFLFGLSVGALASKTVQVLLRKALAKYAGVEA